MNGSRESSVWRALATAFGDGLAFGVGLTLTSKAAGATSKKPAVHSDVQALGDRIAELESRLEGSRPGGSAGPPIGAGPSADEVAAALFARIDSRFSEISAQLGRRLAELEVKIENQNREAAVESRIETLRNELTSHILESQKAFAGALSGVAEEQIEHTVGLRVGAIHERLREAVHDESLTAYGNIGSGVETLIEARLQDLRREMEGGGRLAELRARLEALEGREGSQAREMDARVESRLEELRGRLVGEFEAAKSEAAESAVRVVGNAEMLMEARVQALRQEMEGKDRQIANLAGSLEAMKVEIDAMRSQMAAAREASQQENAGTVRQLADLCARLDAGDALNHARALEWEAGFDARVETRMGPRLESLHEQVREAARDESLSAFASFSNGIESFIEGRLQHLREEIACNQRRAEVQAQALEAAVQARMDALRGELTSAAATSESGLRDEISGSLRQIADLGLRLEAAKVELEAGAAHDRIQSQSHIESLRSEIAGIIDGQRAALDGAINTLRSQMAESQKEFAETLAHVVDEQIEHTIGLRLQTIQQQMRDTVRDEALSAYSSFAGTAETLIDKRIQAFREELGHSQREVTELCTRLEGYERNLLELVLSLGQRCMQAADWMVPGATAPKPVPKGGGGSGFSSEPHITRAGDPELPSFAQLGAPRKLWRLPIVSCFLAAASGFLAIFYQGG